jgi:hypothetical protein
MNRILAFAILTMAACGGGEQVGGASLNGSIAGLSLDNPLEVVSSSMTTSCPGLASPTVSVWLSDKGGRCAGLQAQRTAAPQSTSVWIQLVSIDGSPLAPGLYPIAASELVTPGQKPLPLVSVLISRTDEACDTHAIYATSGTVTIDSIQGDAVSGSFTGTNFQDSTNIPAADGSGAVPGTLSGSFSAGACHVELDCAALSTPGTCG